MGTSALYSGMRDMDGRRSTDKKTSRNTRCGDLNKSQLRSQRTQPVDAPDQPLAMLNEAGSKH